MDWLWIGLGIIFILIGFVGCVLPIIPGPPLSFVALIFLQLTEVPRFSWQFILLWGLIAALVTALDYVVPAYGTKKLGGSRRGVWGSVLGLVIGIIFFPPLGLIIGPILGALVGEMTGGKTTEQAVKSALGSFIGFVFGTVAKLIVSGFIAYYFFSNL